MISAPTENERTVTGMAEYIEREALIEWLKCIPLKCENWHCAIGALDLLDVLRNIDAKKINHGYL